MAPKKSKSKSKKKNKDEDSLVKASPATAGGAGKDGKEEEEPDMTHAYAENLRAEIYTDVNANPKALVHTTEWRKIMNGDPVEINPSVGAGMKIMTVDEWISRWKQNERFPECLSCGSMNTKEHHFTQTWCRGKKKFESETICCECHMWSWRSYADPDFLTPEEYDKLKWEKLVAEHAHQFEETAIADQAAPEAVPASA